MNALEKLNERNKNKGILDDEEASEELREYKYNKNKNNFYAKKNKFNNINSNKNDDEEIASHANKDANNENQFKEFNPSRVNKNYKNINNINININTNNTSNNPASSSKNENDNQKSNNLTSMQDGDDSDIVNLVSRAALGNKFNPPYKK